MLDQMSVGRWLVGVGPAAVQTVVLTHMHDDHAGDFDKFPIANFHPQEPEEHYAAGRYMRHRQLAKSASRTTCAAWCG